MVAGRAFAQTSGEKSIAWTDLPPPIPPPAQNAIHNLTAWESLNSWITPNDKFFSIAHYNRPTIDAAAWRLNLSGLVRPTALTLDQLKAFTKQHVPDDSGDDPARLRRRSHFGGRARLR